MDQATRFRFDYRPGALRFGAGAAADLATELDEQECDRALVVCGSTVGASPPVIDPVRDGLGDKLADVFAETTPEKELATAIAGADALDAADADTIVSLGGGSSLDLAKAISVVAADDRNRKAIAAEFARRGTISIPEAPLPPIVAVPTTLAGADLSIGAGLNASPDTGLVEEYVSGGLSDPRLMPSAVVYDPELFATTPKSVLAASAMNGFNKGIETLYARTATPVTDGTAVRGLQLLQEGLLELGARGGEGGEGEDDGSADDGVEHGVDAAVLEPVVEGTMLVQYGISRPEESTLSLIHAFGHGLTAGYEVQQGAAHAVVTPHALSYLFEQVDGRRDLLADALGVGDAPDPAGAVVDAVTRVRDALGLPSRLRDVAGPEPAAFEAVAETVLEDSFMANAPAALDPTREEIEAVLEAAY
ncbi:iron-containing alcohol dehydrogenase family protein [Haloparvum sp. AD34]